MHTNGDSGIFLWFYIDVTIPSLHFETWEKLEQRTHNDRHEDFTITKAGCVTSGISGAVMGCFGATGFGI